MTHHQADRTLLDHRFQGAGLPVLTSHDAVSQADLRACRA